jgi:hypothetical protein
MKDFGKEKISVHNQLLQRKILMLYKIALGAGFNLPYKNENGREKIGTNQYSRTAAGSKHKHD